MKLSKIFLLLRSLPKTIWFNFRYLPWAQAVKLPVWLAPNVWVRDMHRNAIVLENPVFNSVHIGFHEIVALDCHCMRTIIRIEPGGTWFIGGDVHIGRGAIIHVSYDATLRTGSNFAISGTTSIICTHSVTIGNDAQFSWNSLVMDSDAHSIYDVDGELMNPWQPINIGNHVWVAANVSIMKGAVIGDGCVVAGNSLVNRDLNEPNMILAGSPARPVKKISTWKI